MLSSRRGGRSKPGFLVDIDDDDGDHSAKAKSPRAGGVPNVYTRKAVSAPKQQTLGFQKYAPLYDVAVWSDFTSTQEFAGKGIAALSSISRDRDMLYRTGAVQYMIDLILHGKSCRSKCDACDALVQLLHKDEACRSLVEWRGPDPAGGPAHRSGLGVLFRLRDARSPALQRAGVAACAAALLSDALRVGERIAPEFVAGVCRYGHATDAAAARDAAWLLVRLVRKVADKYAQWSVPSLSSITDLLRSATVTRRVKSLCLRAVSLITKEDHDACRLLSQIGCIKIVSLQMAARGAHPVDPDDLNYLRIVTQICEADPDKYEDVVIIGALQRIILVLRKHLVDQSVLLPEEVEVQRRGSRFLERLASLASTRQTALEAGCVSLFLDMLGMPRCALKGAAAHSLMLLCDDAHVQGLWQRFCPGAMARMSDLLEDPSIAVRIKMLNALRLLCAHADNCAELFAGFAAAAVRIVRNFEEACAMTERDEQYQLLLACSRLLMVMTGHPGGRDQLAAWNMVARVDPNMRKMRVPLNQHHHQELWRTHEKFLAVMQS